MLLCGAVLRSSGPAAGGGILLNRQDSTIAFPCPAKAPIKFEVRYVSQQRRIFVGDMGKETGMGLSKVSGMTCWVVARRDIRDMWIPNSDSSR